MTSPTRAKSVDEILETALHWEKYNEMHDNILTEAKQALLSLLEREAEPMWTSEMIDKSADNHEPAVSIQAVPLDKIRSMFNE